MLEAIFRRLPAIARLLLGEYRDALGLANIGWLEFRRDRDDWQPEDIVRLREMLPAALLWLLYSDHPTDERTRRT